MKILFFFIPMLISCVDTNKAVFYWGDIKEINGKDVCTDEILGKITFVVHKDKNQIMKIEEELGELISNGKSFNSDFLDECKIIDVNNFICGGIWKTIGKRISQSASWSVSDGRLDYSSQKIYFLDNSKSDIRNNDINCFYNKTLLGYSKN